MFEGRETVDGCRVEGEVMSADRRRIRAVAIRDWRGRPRVFEVRIGWRKEGCGAGRPMEVSAWVSCWRVGGLAILGSFGSGW